MDFQIKKSAELSKDARPSRWTGGEKVDVAIKELQLDKRKVVLSIKDFEEQDRDIAFLKLMEVRRVEKLAIFITF